MRDWLAASAERAPDRPFLVTPDGTWSFGAVEVKVRRVSGALRALGLQRGDRVAVWAANDLPSVAALFAVPRTGAAAVILSRRLTAAEASTQATDAGVRVALAPPDAPHLGVARHDPAELTGPEWGGRRPFHHRTHSILFTSGSRGKPKGVGLTWGNLEVSAAASAQWLGHRPTDSWLAVLPVYHVGGLMILVRSARQGSRVLLEPFFAPGRAAEMLRSGEATLASLVATMLGRILDAEPGPYRGVGAVLLGGGPTPASLLERARGAGLPVLPTYGMTETASLVAAARLGGGDRMYALPGAKVRVGPTGRIWVRGPMVAPGYLRVRARSGRRWLDTGDQGEMDADGGLRVLGRADDTIITGGENVHPLEVEAVLAGLPGVDEVAVVGLPDPEWGQVVAAAFVGSASVEAMEAEARARLAGYKVPRRWRRIDEIPRTTLGKIWREQLTKVFHD